MSFGVLDERQKTGCRHCGFLAERSCLGGMWLQWTSVWSGCIILMESVMKPLITVVLVVVLSSLTPALQAQNMKANIPYAAEAHERQVLDIYAAADAAKQPVVFWIHGGGWVTGDKSQVQVKPEFFVERGFVFVSTNYRLLPHVPMETIVQDVAQAVGWVHQHIQEYGGDPQRILIMGHSAGAQLAALICTDHRYLQAHQVPLSVIQGCVPVDGDTYDIPAIIETAETRRRVHGQPQAKYGHREKFGNDPQKHVNFSAVTHIATGKSIPPFLILHVADHPDTSAQAQRLAAVLRSADVPVTVFAGKQTDHSRLNANLGLADDPATAALLAFLKGIPAVQGNF